MGSITLQLLLSTKVVTWSPPGMSSIYSYHRTIEEKMTAAFLIFQQESTVWNESQHEDCIDQSIYVSSD